MEEELFSEICNEENESLIKHQLKEVCITLNILFLFSQIKETHIKKVT